MLTSDKLFYFPSFELGGIDIHRNRLKTVDPNLFRVWIFKREVLLQCLLKHVVINQ